MRVEHRRASGYTHHLFTERRRFRTRSRRAAPGAVGVFARTRVGQHARRLRRHATGLASRRAEAVLGWRPEFPTYREGSRNCAVAIAGRSTWGVRPAAAAAFLPGCQLSRGIRPGRASKPIAPVLAKSTDNNCLCWTDSRRLVSFVRHPRQPQHRRNHPLNIARSRQPVVAVLDQRPHDVLAPQLVRQIKRMRPGHIGI